MVQLADQHFPLPLRPPALRDVFDREQDQLQVIDPTRVEQHDAVADRREVMLDLDIFEEIIVRQNLREQATQIRDVPLAMAKVVDHAPLGRGRLHPEGIVEGAIGGLHPQIFVEDQEWLADSIDDLLGQLLMVLQQPPAAPLLRDIFNRDEDQGRAIAGAAQRPCADQHDLLADIFEGVLDFELLNGALLGQHLREQLAQAWDVPLSVTKVVDQATLGVRLVDLERLVKGAVGGMDAQVLSQNEERLPDRGDNTLGEDPGFLRIRRDGGFVGHRLSASTR